MASRVDSKSKQARPATASAAARRAGASERANSRGEATRQTILETAERMFAEQGIAAVALRDIGAAAGQKNNVAVQYHFGDRDGLVRAITLYRAQGSEARRVAMLADLLRSGRPPTVTDLVRAFVMPLAAMLDRDNYYLAFLSRVMIERGAAERIFSPTSPTSSVVSPTVETLRTTLASVLPEIPPDVLDERWVMMASTAIHTLARYQISIHAGGLRPDDSLIDELVRFLSAGIQAEYPNSGDSDEQVARR